MTVLTRTKRGRLVKKDPVLLRQVRRYIRRHGGTADEVFDLLTTARMSGPREAERKLEEAMREERMNATAIKMARDGYWSDFKSPLDFPKVELVNMLRESKRYEFAERVENGEFDG